VLIPTFASAPLLTSAGVTWAAIAGSDKKELTVFASSILELVEFDEISVCIF
jgi:hypothetical protein